MAEARSKAQQAVEALQVGVCVCVGWGGVGWAVAGSEWVVLRGMRGSAGRIAFVCVGGVWQPQGQRCRRA